MSNSSDGSGAPPHRGTPRRPGAQVPQIAPETRAARRYGVERPYGQPQPVSWTDADPSQAFGEHDDDHAQGHGVLYDDIDPRTGPPNFEFTPSPLQPRQGQGPVAAGGRNVPPPPGPSHNRLPDHPDELRHDEDVTDPRTSRGVSGHSHDLGSVQPDNYRQVGSHRDDAGLSAPTRMRRSQREMAHAPIVPAGSVTGKSMTLVVAIMCFLACLTTGAVYLMIQSASAWLRDIAGEITVQVEARDKTDVERQVREVAAFLAKQNGVTNVKPLSLEASASLLEPWLGQTEGLRSLPVPRMIAVEVDRISPPDFTTLRANLIQQFKGTTLDDHRHWQQQIRTVTRSFALGGIAILALVGAATMAIIVSATKSALASNREIVEVLHFVGATDRFIAGQFQKHFLRLGIRAGLFGAILAALVFLGMPIVMELLGGGSAALTEMQHLIGAGALDVPGYGWLAVVVVAISAICMITSRFGVYRILNSQN